MIEKIEELKEELKSNENAKNNQELDQKLYKLMIDFIEINKKNDTLETSLLTLGFFEARQEICNYLANNQNDYDYLFVNYDKIYNKIKVIYKEDLKFEKMKAKNQKNQLSFCGLNLFDVLIIAPILLFYYLIKGLSKRS